MIQSKNKFLPTLYIRKCKITYLECFAIIQTDDCYGQLFSSSEAGHYSCTLYTNVRINGWMDKWMNERMSYNDQAGAPWGTLRERTQTTQRWMYTLRICVGKQIYMEHRKTSRETISWYTWVYLHVWAVCDLCIRKQKEKKPRWIKQLPTAPAARGNTTMRVLVSTFELWKLCRKV